MLPTGLHDLTALLSAALDRCPPIPRPAGTALKLFLPLVEGPLGGPIIRKLMRNNGLPQVGGRTCLICSRQPAANMLQAAASLGMQAGPPAGVHQLLCCPAGLMQMHSSHQQILEELYIPEAPTFRPNTAGWRAEDDVAWDLVRAGA